jgi:hypothetical protein
MPIDATDPVIERAVEAADFVRQLNQQPLRVTGLAPGAYALRIDDEQVGVFRAAELQHGINLAVLPTPMRRQADEVHGLTLKHNDIHFTRWRYIQTPMEKDTAQRTAAALDALDRLEQEIVDRQHATARPRLRRFELVPVAVVAANVPRGFTPVFGTGELRRVLLDSNRRKNLEVYLEVDAGADAGAGLLLRMTEKGQGYRVSLDGREGATFGHVDVPGMSGIKDNKAPTVEPWAPHWKKGEWNAVRVRIDGDKPHITVWLNDAKIADWSDGAAALEEDNDGWGLAAIDLPAPGEKALPFRNVAIHQLP